MELLTLLAGSGAALKGVAALVSAFSNRRTQITYDLRGSQLHETPGGLFAATSSRAAHVSVRFEPADTATREVIFAEHPVVVLLAVGGSPEPEAMAVVELGDELAIELPIGVYDIGAVVLEQDEVQEDSLVPVALGEARFSVDPDDIAFTIVLPIEAPEANVVIAAEEAALTGQCRALTSRRTRCLNSPLSGSLLCRLHEARALRGDLVVDAESGLEIVVE